jgi:hypothetical protein
MRTQSSDAERILESRGLFTLSEHCWMLEMIAMAQAFVRVTDVGNNA